MSAPETPGTQQPSAAKDECTEESRSTAMQDAAPSSQADEAAGTPSNAIKQDIAPKEDSGHHGNATDDTPQDADTAPLHSSGRTRKRDKVKSFFGRALNCVT